MTKGIMGKIEKVNAFLDNYEKGSELKIYMSAGEKTILEDYVHKHPKGGKEFYFTTGFLKPGFLERDFRLRKRQ